VIQGHRKWWGLFRRLKRFSYLCLIYKFWALQKSKKLICKASTNTRTSIYTTHARARARARRNNEKLRNSSKCFFYWRFSACSLSGKAERISSASRKSDDVECSRWRSKARRKLAQNTRAIRWEELAGLITCTKVNPEDGQYYLGISSYWSGGICERWSALANAKHALATNRRRKLRRSVRDDVQYAL